MKYACHRLMGPAVMLTCLMLPAAAKCQEVFGGVLLHDVAITRSAKIERGEDFELGFRFRPILASLGGLRPQVLVLANTRGGADLASAGLSWKLGSRVYLRPSLGIAVHTGDVHVTPTFLQRHRIPFGSPVLFTPAIAGGVQITKRTSLEATWMHFSHAGLFSSTNPGLDDIGLALNVSF